MYPCGIPKKFKVDFLRGRSRKIIWESPAVFYIVITEFILLIVPENLYKRYIKLIIGTMLMIIVLKQINDFFEVLQ